MANVFELESSVKLDSKDVLEQLKKLDSQFEETSDSAEKAESKFIKFSKGLGNVSTKISNFGSKLGDIGKNLSTKVTLPIFGLGTASVKFASDLNESLNKVEVAFGNNANEVISWSDTTLEKFGIAKGTALDMAATFGDMGTSMGLSTSEASNMATSLSGLAGDLASFKNIDIKQALTALNGVFTGETESLKTLGIVMTQTNLDTYALANGFGKTTSEMTEAEKVNLRYSYVMNATKNAHGDFARTSDGTANSMRVFQESLKELGATMGQNILPVITPIIQKFSELVKRFSDLSPETQKTILVIGGLVASLGPVLTIGGNISKVIGGVSTVFSTVSGAIGVVTTGATAATPAIGALASVFTFLTSPVGLVIMAITALIAVGVLLWKNWDTVKEKASQLGTWLSDKFNGIKNSITGAIESAVSSVESKFSNMKEKVSNTVNSIKGFFGNLRLPEIKIPHIKLPHFNLTGSFSLKPPSVPKLNVDWYSDGAIFTKKTVLGNGLGVGDAHHGQGNNAEGIIPLDILWDKMDKIANRPIQVYITARELARAIASEMKNELNKLEMKDVRFVY
ncbi:phage tail tape measure protein [Clostridium tertium]|uniref:phage tail tape measure protein n=1 Tax=Clostridium tertium TaxID=1559 RepID=UPI0018AA57C8|nr:phage tail tape measure protein [Clostridium tertium]